MSLTAQDGVEVVKALAWPITILVALASLHRPISELIRTIGRRAAKFSIFQVEFELAKLTQATSLETTVEALRKEFVQDSGAAPIVAGVTRSGAADYVVVAIGANADQKWRTNRLFILSAILERSRIRCIVFTGERDTFLGAATPRDVRADLGARFPEYEQALFQACGETAKELGLGEFRGGNLSEIAVGFIVRTFLSAENIFTWVAPAQLTGWVHLDRSKNVPVAGTSSWEFAEYSTASGLNSMLRDRLSRGSVVATSGTVASEDVTRAIVRQTGAFVALLDASGRFEGLCDRGVIVDKLARSAVEQTTSA